jgi:hypothetical protein
LSDRSPKESSDQQPGREPDAAAAQLDPLPSLVSTRLQAGNQAFTRFARHASEAGYGSPRSAVTGGRGRWQLRLGPDGTLEYDVEPAATSRS